MVYILYRRVHKKLNINHNGYLMSRKSIKLQL